MKNVLVIGASGLVGSNIIQYFKTEYNVLGTYFSYKTENTIFLDVNDYDSINHVEIESFKPNVIIHCGALTNVDLCELENEKSYLNTVQSTQNIIKLSEKYGAKLIYISTDYVFDGVNGPYDENDSPNPINVYGEHKLKAENLVKNLNDFLIIRITNVYGNELRNKNFISRIINQIQKKESIVLTLPYDQFATPINSSDIAKALILLINKKCKGVYNISSTDYLNRVHLAQKVLSHFAYNNFTLKTLPTAELNQSAKRPLNGGLKNNKFVNEFPDFLFTNVNDYLSSQNI
jgi:dTDP-4-dehydrorhamnose reductase